ncbi:hypothetical protein [Kitasatospora purpeofusca]|uniref:hypothetical protein n=1 Tax=Kitasatospora purpeofusca TaxID=67352 RepID=UPI0036D07664
MPRSRFTTEQIHLHLHTLLDENPNRTDDGPGYDQPPRILYRGKPGCLTGVILHRLGASEGVLRALDTELVDTQFTDVRHPWRNRLTPTAWLALDALHNWGPEEGSWALAHSSAFGPRPSYRGRRADRDRRPWLYSPAETPGLSRTTGTEPCCRAHPPRRPN